MHTQKTITIKILDEVNVAVIGLIGDHLDALVNKYAKHVPNYFFQPKYKLGVWDGKIQYFKPTGKTYVVLLDEIVPLLQNLGYKLKLIDCREYGDAPDLINENHFSHISHPETGKPFVLRYYQVEGVNALIENDGGICIAGTGAGKTIMNAALVDSYEKLDLKTITIVPSQDLIKQTKHDFILWGLDTGEYSGDIKNTNHSHVVSTWQALQNNPKVMNEFHVVVVDECHGLKGPVLNDILNKHGRNIKYRFGLTGTLPKATTDRMSVRVSVGNVMYEIPAHQLIEEEYLSDMRVDIFQLQENFEEEYKEHKLHNRDSDLTYSQFKESYFPDWNSEKSHLQTYEERLDWIKHFIETKRDAKKGNVFCLINGINFGKKLSSLVDHSVFVYGADKQKVRKKIYDLFEKNDNLVVIASIQIASTGLNIPRIFNLMFIDVGKSFVRVIQSIGRGLRKADDKSFVWVSDICSDLKYSKRHLTQRIGYYKEAKYNYKKRIVKYDE